MILLGLHQLDRAAARADPFTVINPTFEVKIDGRFTGGVQGGVITGEWQGIAPLLFQAPLTPGLLRPTTFGDPNISVYAPVGIGSLAIADEFYALQAFRGRTQPSSVSGEFIGDICFPTVNTGQLALPPPAGVPVGERFLATLQIRSDGLGGFRFFVDLNGDGILDGLASALDIEAAGSFAPSPLSDLPHLIVEFEMPLLVAPGFGDLNGNGKQDGAEVFPPEGLAVSTATNRHSGWPGLPTMPAKWSPR